MEGRKHLIDWLRDAHAMEKKSTALLEKQVMRIENYPEMRTRIQQHLEETQRQAQRLEECISRLDSGSSTMKDMMGTMMGNVGAMFNSGTSDEIVKNTLGNFAIENFEVACYRSLIAAAEEVGDEHTARICREILREEEAMVEWIGRNIEMVTRMYMQRDAMGETAKH